MKQAKGIREATDEELVAELQRRQATAKQLEAAAQGNEYAQKVSPVGLWRVTTEGDCEGRTTRQLGVYDGHIADIAARLADRVYYSLTFCPGEPTEDLPTPSHAVVSVCLDIGSGTWAMTKEERTAFFSAWMSHGPAEYHYKLADGQYHASVIVEARK